MFDWQVFEEGLGLSDIVGVPYECYVDGYRLFADGDIWTVTDDCTSGRELAWGRCISRREGMTASEAWVGAHRRSAG